MSLVYPSSIITEFYNGSSWVNISAYVVSDISTNTGYYSTNPTEFTSGIGTAAFDLDNSSHLFTVYGGDSVRGLSTLSGWGRGTKIRFRVKYFHYDKVIWLGFIQTINSDDYTWGDQRAHVTCMDWMDIATNYSMKKSPILLNKNLGDGVQSIINRVSVAPEGFISGTYSNTFTAIFDNVRSKTKAISEMDKLARSETGYVYLTKDGYVVAEGKTDRKGTEALTQIPGGVDNALMYDPNVALMFDTNTVLILDAQNAANLSSVSEKLELNMKDEFWNEIFVRSYPTVTDTSLVTLFSIGEAIPIMGGTKISFVGNYTNPNGGLPVNGTNMQTPTTPTDYLMNTASDGSGSNISANLTVTADYYGDVVVYTLASSYTSGIGYITKLQARGFGIYRNSATEANISITGSASAYGDKSLDLNQTYQNTTYDGLLYGASILEIYKTPKTRISAATFCANLNGDNMSAFLHLGIGDLISIYDDRSGMTKWYHILSIKTLLALGSIITFTFGLREHLSLASGGLNPVAVDFSGLSAGDAVDFGYIPQISGDNVSKYTIALWIYLRSINANFTTLVNLYADTGANTYFYLQGGTSTKLTLQSFRFSGGAGRWRVPTNALVTGTWSHIAVSYDLNVSSDPVIYINGVSQTLTEEQTPSGSLISAVGTRLIIGNNGTYTNGIDGILKDVRVYDKVLSQSEITSLYNGGVVDTSLVTDHLVFQGLEINSDLGTATSLNGQQLPADNKFFDNILRLVGEIKGTPTISNQ